MRTPPDRHVYTSPEPRGPASDAVRTHCSLPVYTWAAGLAAAIACAGCSEADPQPRADRTLVLAAYSAPREALEQEILPTFSADFRARTGKTIRVEASYLASGAQARAVLGGFAADVVLLAMAPDVDKLAAAGIVAKAWADGPDRGMVASSVVAFAVRTGNPRGIRGWADLARPGVSVLMPNPRTSGGAMWNISALWGTALRGDAGFPPGDQDAACDYLRSVLKNVAVLDKGGRESVITFEKGVGDVAVTYESEIVAGRLAGRTYDAVIPDTTLHIEIPAAVAFENAAKHGVMAEAEAFVAFLRSDAAQRAFARFGFRKPDGTSAASEEQGDRPRPTTLFTIRELGGWNTIVPKLFGPDGEFTKTWERVYAE
jgi:sulfate/thiosulfate transport system substrate-binding protein